MSVEKKTYTIRLTVSTHGRLNKQKKKTGLSISQMIENLVQTSAEYILDCNGKSMTDPVVETPEVVVETPEVVEETPEVVGAEVEVNEEESADDGEDAESIPDVTVQAEGPSPVGGNRVEKAMY